MSALLTHAAAGLVIGLALGLRPRSLPLAALITCLPDLDHLGLPGLVARGTLSNVFVCIALPLALLSIAVHKRVRGEALRLFAAAPVLLVTHLVLDLLPLDPLGDAEGVRLLYPLSDDAFFVRLLPIRGMDPFAVSTFTLAFVALTAAILWTGLLVRRADQSGGTPRAGFAAFTLAWVLLVPLVGASGLLVPAPVHPNAELALEDAQFELPEGRFVAVVAHAGGHAARVGSLQIDVLVDGQKVASATNPRMLSYGQRWVVDIPVDVRGHSMFGARLVATGDAHSYLDERVHVVRSHVPTRLDLTRASGTVAILNAGPRDVPAGALHATASGLDGGSQLDAVNPRPVRAGDAWTLPAAPLGVRFTVVGVDDGYAYLENATA